jgi:glutaminyl-tRNA synthetase
VAIKNPILVEITNYDAAKEEFFDLPNHPQKPELGTRAMPFSREIYIDADDFAEVPPPKFFRLKPEGEVRLMGAYIIKCGEIVKNEDGSIKEIHVTADLETGNGNPVDGRKIKGTIHWLSANNAYDAQVVMYDKLLTLEDPSKLPKDKEYTDYLNPESETVLTNAKLEKCLTDAKEGERFQFVRTGYFTPDSKNPGTFLRTVTLKDSYKPQ